MYFALYMYSMPVDLRFRRLRAQNVAVLVPTLRSISRETDFVHVSDTITNSQNAFLTYAVFEFSFRSSEDGGGLFRTSIGIQIRFDPIQHAVPSVGIIAIGLNQAEYLANNQHAKTPPAAV